VLFDTTEFGIFLCVVFALYVMSQRSTQIQNILLLVASYLFYSFWDYRFLTLIVISTVVDYTIGKRLAITPVENSNHRKRLLFVSISVNLGLLGFFKYWNFFIDSVASGLMTLGLEPNLPLLTIILPVGISFYTFQTMSYTIDIYRNKLSPEDNFITFALFVCYFPQLVAGPIERAQLLLPRLRSARIVTLDNIASGSALILIGLFKKIAIADAIAPIVDIGFTSIQDHGWVSLLFYAYLFGFQIYADFSGYSDIARGVSRLFGIELMINFEQPYFASNLQDFWRRWHISLSTWLRDYLYIPLGGNRHGEWKTYRNLMLTMVIGGLWHGAAWTFVIWGAIHGVVLSITRYWNEQGILRDFTNRYQLFTAILGTIVTFHIVTLAWIFFRAESFNDSLVYIGRIVAQSGTTNMDYILKLSVIYSFIFILMVDLPQMRLKRQDFLVKLSSTKRAIYVGIMILILIIWGAQSANNVPFIYFQF